MIALLIGLASAWAGAMTLAILWDAGCLLWEWVQFKMHDPYGKFFGGA